MDCAVDRLAISRAWIQSAIYHAHGGRREFSPLVILAQDTRIICFVVCKSAEGCARGLPGLLHGHMQEWQKSARV